MITDSSNEFLASVLQNSAGAMAGYTASELLEVVPSAAEAFQANPFSMWQNWLKRQVEELAAAIAVGEPKLFVSHTQWGKAVLEARGVSPAHFRSGLECLRNVLATELPEEGRKLAETYLESALNGFDEDAKGMRSRLSPETPAGRLASRYLLAVLEGDRRRARELVLDGSTRGLTIPQIYLEVILPAQEEIGRMWVANEITVSEEHFATATTRTILAQLLARAPIRASNGKTVMTAAVAGNRHDIGLQVVCDFFEMDGWRAIQLGADVPTGDLVAAVEGFRVNLLALSTTQAVHLQVLRDTIETVRHRRSSDVLKILVGGLAFTSCPELAGDLGADAFAAGPVEAVEIAAALFNIPRDPNLSSGS